MRSSPPSWSSSSPDDHREHWNRAFLTQYEKSDTDLLGNPSSRASLTGGRPSFSDNPSRTWSQTMSEQSTIHYERTSPQAAKITFVNPPVNLIVGETVRRLTEIVEELAADPDIQVVVFDSATPDFFYNHFDLAAAADFPSSDDEDAVPVWTSLVLALSKAPYITIAAIRGRTRGGGNELALALDLRYASREKAIFGQPEVGSGLLPGGGGTERLPRTIGRDRALEVILTSDDYDAETAERWGWITRVLPDSELDAFVDTVVARLASFDRTSLAAAKAQVNRASLPPDADLVAAYSEFAHSLTLPGFLIRAAGTKAIVEQAGIDFEYRLGEYIGIANQQRLCPTRNEHGRSGSRGSARLLPEPGRVDRAADQGCALTPLLGGRSNGASLLPWEK
jgi:enoyl-CoA hydratase/carnithine racemase